MEDMNIPSIPDTQTVEATSSTVASTQQDTRSYSRKRLNSSSSSSQENEKKVKMK